MPCDFYSFSNVIETSITTATNVQKNTLQYKYFQITKNGPKIKLLEIFQVYQRASFKMHQFHICMIIKSFLLKLKKEFVFN